MREKDETFLGTAILLILSLQIFAICPYGLVDDTYPGACGRYIDVDTDGICDYSQGV